MWKCSILLEPWRTRWDLWVCCNFANVGTPLVISIQIVINQKWSIDMVSNNHCPNIKIFRVLFMFSLPLRIICRSVPAILTNSRFVKCNGQKTFSNSSTHYIQFGIIIHCIGECFFVCFIFQKLPKLLFRFTDCPLDYGLLLLE